MKNDFQVGFLPFASYWLQFHQSLKPKKKKKEGVALVYRLNGIPVQLP